MRFEVQERALPVQVVVNERALAVSALAMMPLGDQPRRIAVLTGPSHCP